MTIRNVRWELETTFTRKQVIAMAKLAEYVGNIQAELSKGFPSTFKGFDWDSVYQVMTLFDKLRTEDTIGCKSLCKAVDDVNTGKVALLSGKVVEVDATGE